MEENARGGDDHLIASNRFTVLIGDANEMNGRAVGGDDYLRSKVGDCSLYSDSQPMTGHARGGNDVLRGSDGSDTLYGDALFAIDHSRCGNDVLRGGKGNDIMYGDAASLAPTVTPGADRFVFAKQSGQDWIGDFQRGLDHLDVRAIGYTGFGQLTIDQVGDHSVVHFRGDNQVTLVGVTGLTASDFLFD
jgi:Ca2+-binding RTX toxin-like protein